MFVVRLYWSMDQGYQKKSQLVCQQIFLRGTAKVISVIPLIDVVIAQSSDVEFYSLHHVDACARLGFSMKPLQGKSSQLITSFNSVEFSQLIMMRP